MTINGDNEKTTFIQAGTNTTNGVDRVLHIEGVGITVEINDVTIRHGKTADGASDSPGERGGGIYNDSATLTLSDCTVSYNRTGAGGNGSPYLDGGQGGYGGGIYLDSNSVMTLTNSTISDNATGDGGSEGGQGNFGGSGGGIYSRGTSLTLIESTVSGNTTGAGGGWRRLGKRQWRQWRLRRWHSQWNERNAGGSRERHL